MAGFFFKLIIQQHNGCFKRPTKNEYKMLYLKSLLVIGCYVVFFTSCTANKYIYSPATANLLTPTNKGNVQAAINYSSAAASFNGLREKQHSNGIDIQTVFALDNKLAIRADYYRKKENSIFKKFDSDSLDNYVSYNKSGTEISIGFYKISTGDNNTVFQIFAGAGTGNFYLRETIKKGMNVDFFHEMNYNKFFIHPSFNFQNGKNFSFNFSTRVNTIFYNNLKSNMPDIKQQVLGYLNDKPSVFGDIIFHSQFGFKRLEIFKFQIQTGISKLFTKNFYAGNIFREVKYPFNNKWIAMGVITDINKIFKK